VHRAPPADLPLQRPHLAGLELAEVPPAQLVHQRRGQELAVLIAAQERLDLSRLHLRERIADELCERVVRAGNMFPSMEERCELGPVAFMGDECERLEHRRCARRCNHAGRLQAARHDALRLAEAKWKHRCRAAVRSCFGRSTTALPGSLGLHSRPIGLASGSQGMLRGL
jgi:hypothetical protein